MQILPEILPSPGPAEQRACLSPCCRPHASGSCLQLFLGAVPGLARCLGQNQGSFTTSSIGCPGSGLPPQPMAGRPSHSVSLPAVLFLACKQRGQGTLRPLCFLY